MVGIRRIAESSVADEYHAPGGDHRRIPFLVLLVLAVCGGAMVAGVATNAT
jgi:uncharacterized membrane protein YsdA (DUF1294 family)